LVHGGVGEQVRAVAVTGGVDIALRRAQRAVNADPLVGVIHTRRRQGQLVVLVSPAGGDEQALSAECLVVVGLQNDPISFPGDASDAAAVVHGDALVGEHILELLARVPISVRKKMRI